MSANPVAMVLIPGAAVVGLVYVGNHLWLWWTARGIRKPPKSYERIRV